MPKTRELIERRGATFVNLVVSTPGCCPSRASILRGQYTRNHEVRLRIPDPRPYLLLRGILPDAAKKAEPTLLGDKGYDSRRFQQFVQERASWLLIPTRRCIPTGQATGEPYAEDTALGWKRYVAERTLSWLKRFRRLRFRVDRAAASFQTFVYLAVPVLCARRLISQARAGIHDR